MKSTTANAPGFGPAIELFRRATRDVPAYMDFLAKRGVVTAEIHTSEDFAAVPVMTKAGYLQHYPLDQRIWHGDVTEAGTWSTSSGSSGRPTYWPRDQVSLQQSIEFYDRILCANFQSDQRSTLVVVGFAMGTWIGGIYTYTGVLPLRRKGYPVSVITPGISTQAIVEAIVTLGPYYDQVVLVGYPPFVKDVLDQALDDVLRQDVKILLAGEAVTEAWRDYVLERLGKQGHPEQTCLIYGTADAGIMGHETPATIAIRRRANEDTQLGAALFGVEGTAVQPTFVEYDPRYRYAETDKDGYLLFTIDGTIPLIRYRINDQGRVYSGTKLVDVLEHQGHTRIAKGVNRAAGYIALYGRSDIATTFHSLNIYPENLQSAFQENDVESVLTGKFIVDTTTDDQHEQTLRLQVEVRRGSAPTVDLPSRIHKLAVTSLMDTNSEYRALHDTLGMKAEPVITFHEYGTGGFAPDIKHRWTGAHA